MRILIVTMADSIHMARWINQLSGQGWDVHLFGVSDARPHADLRNVTVHSFSSGKYAGAHDSVRIASIWPVPRGCGALVKIAEKLRPGLIDRARWLARVIRNIQPDIVHSQEIQHGAYLTMAARKLVDGRFPTWIVSNWGSDIFLFGRLAAHVDRIKEVLQHCDFYACECHRDIDLARDLGFRGHVLPVLPIGGGFDLEQIAALRSPGPASTRSLVVLKGNQHFAGRALIGLTALRMCAKKIGDRRIAIYNARPEVVLAGELLAKETGLQVGIVPPCSHEDMLRLFGQARIYLGLSISDGISTSLLEALSMGAFPIQSWTACADEWIQDGANGLLVPPEDPYAVAAALRQALKDDELVDEAAEINANACAERLDQRLIRASIIDFYRRAATGTGEEGDFKLRCGCELPLLDGKGWNRRTMPCAGCKKALTAPTAPGVREARSCVS